jgi:molybdenum cofactor guanylyltransferase
LKIANQPTLAILAGGEGARMGMPKSLLRINDTPILEYLLQRLNWPGPTLLVTSPGREHPPAAQLFTREVADPVPGQGPLRGLATALQHADTDLVLATVVDMPLITRGQLDWLALKLSAAADKAGLLLLRRLAGQDQIEPFPSIYRRELALPLILDQLAQNRRPVHALAALRPFQLTPAPFDWPADMWLNLNTPDDLSNLKVR